MKFEGGCYCKAVRYQAEGEPVFKGQCHCRECQYLTGGQPERDHGDAGKRLQIHERRAESVQAQRSAERGNARILRRVRHASDDAIGGSAGRRDVKVGTMDDPSLYGTPQMAIFTIDKQAFHQCRPAFRRSNACLADGCVRGDRARTEAQRANTAMSRFRPNRRRRVSARSNARSARRASTKCSATSARTAAVDSSAGRSSVEEPERRELPGQVPGRHQGQTQTGRCGRAREVRGIRSNRFRRCDDEQARHTRSGEDPGARGHSDRQGDGAGNRQGARTRHRRQRDRQRLREVAGAAHPGAQSAPAKQWRAEHRFRWSRRWSKTPRRHSA